ncbi:hypothetical protein PTI98_009014 [Pleurotus ostreatus]|nr:hypothetical protein PTI98_009014 [Pleurotus ostreatus]
MPTHTDSAQTQSRLGGYTRTELSGVTSVSSDFRAPSQAHTAPAALHDPVPAPTVTHIDYPSTQSQSQAAPAAGQGATETEFADEIPADDGDEPPPASQGHPFANFYTRGARRTYTNPLTLQMSQLIQSTQATHDLLRHTTQQLDIHMAELFEARYEQERIHRAELRAIRESVATIPGALIENLSTLTAGYLAQMELMLTRVMSNAVSTGIAIGMGAKPPSTSFAPGFESRHDARDERQASQGGAEGWLPLPYPAAGRLVLRSLVSSRILMYVVSRVP